MINERYSIAMSETLHYLKGINKEDVNKIPNKFMEFLKANASKNYECDFDYTKPLKELKLMDETRGLISMICLNYWCQTEEQKENFRKHLNKNEIKYQEELRNLYNPDNIFKNKSADDEILIHKEMSSTNAIVKVEKSNIVKIILNKIKKFLHIF